MDFEKIPIVLSNWKMNKTIKESLEYLSELAKAIERDSNRREIILCVPFGVIKILADHLNGPKPIALSGQNVHWMQWGAYTGEISAAMLADLGASYCMIGHSERRKHFNETDEITNKKALALLKSDVRPIVCIGESFEERQLGLTINVLERQLRICFNSFSSSDLEKTIILYEPRWAIGTGQVANSDQIEEAHNYIRKELGRLYSIHSARRTRIIYGGSVTTDNIMDITKIEDVDGVGVGGASLNPGGFLQIVNAV